MGLESPAPRLEDLGLIGNCQYAALVARSGSVNWCCLPRLDAEPVFGALLDADDGGVFHVGPAGGAPGVQRYLPNTNVLETTFRSPEGAFRVLDLAPRYFVQQRVITPTQLVRIVEPLEGTPRIEVRCDPRLGWSKKRPERLESSDHIDFVGYPRPLRLTSDIPQTFLTGAPFALTGRHHLVLTWGAPPEEPLPSLCERHLSETVRYWQVWVKHCDVPPHFQDEVIRSALTLKLHCYEDTGAIVASTTMAIPESAGSGRTWDYRYCWLRDAYYVLDAFRTLGHFEEREKFLHYLLNIAGGNPELDLSPLYRIDGSSDLQETVLDEWAGFGGDGPVRLGNAAALHKQHDLFGELVLALEPVFLDSRFESDRTRESLDLIERLARRALAVAGTPDAGIWELRTEWTPQTFSSVMCWAAADRAARIASIHRPAIAAEMRGAAERLHQQIVEHAWNPGLGAFVSSYGGQMLDASLIQLTKLRFLAPKDPRLASTIEAIANRLGRDGWLFRYAHDDGFGQPTVAFVICTLWLAEALALMGRRDEGRALLERVRTALSPLGLLAEDYDPVGHQLWGNFPQAYSHAGLINAAFATSPTWSEIL
ncbi:MAG TPA: glycoside hydrolase family 15 protein [Polyangia bacterium]